MKILLELLKRDLKNSVNVRAAFLLAFMVLLQAWFILGSSSVEKVIEAGQMHFMAIVFSFNLFGSIIALALSFDTISKERENKVLDLILTANVSKNKVLLAKLLNSLIISVVFAAAYVFIIFLIYLFISGNTGVSLQAFRYILPVTAFLYIYNIMGLMLSIIMRSSKSALIVSVILGGLLIPRLFVAMAEGLGNALGLDGKSIETISMLSPALIMNALSGYGELDQTILGTVLFVIYIAVMILLSMRIFAKQDELNYGE